MEIRKEWGFVSVQIDYNPYYMEQLKLLGGKWHAEEKVWHLPPSQYDAVVELFERNKPTQEVPMEKEVRIQEVVDDLRRLGYSEKTIKSYKSHIKSFLNYGQTKCDLGTINGYLLELLEVKHSSHSYCNQAVNAIKIYARKYSTIEETEIIKLQRPKKEKKLPKVMSQSEVKAIFEATNNIKHKTELMMAYSCGLRVGEVAALQVMDIDSKRMVVIIHQGKGRKDRQSILSNKMLDQLREYYKEYHPKEWLFENPSKDGPIASRTLQVVFNNAVKKANIKKHVTFHSLRHYVDCFVMVSVTSKPL